MDYPIEHSVNKALIVENKNAPQANRRGVFASGDLQTRKNHELVAPVLRPAFVVA